MPGPRRWDRGLGPGNQPQGVALSHRGGTVKIMVPYLGVHTEGGIDVDIDTDSSCLSKLWSSGSSIKGLMVSIRWYWYWACLKWHLGGGGCQSYGPLVGSPC